MGIGRNPPETAYGAFWGDGRAGSGPQLIPAQIQVEGVAIEHLDPHYVVWNRRVRRGPQGNRQAEALMESAVLESPRQTRIARPDDEFREPYFAPGLIHGGMNERSPIGGLLRRDPHVRNTRLPWRVAQEKVPAESAIP